MHYHRAGYNRASLSKKERRRAKKMRAARNDFLIHLAVYHFINGVNLVEFLKGDAGRGWYSMAFFWGVGLFFHYLKVFGAPGTEIRALAGDPERLIGQEPPDENLELRPLQKSWSDKDLV